MTIACNKFEYKHDRAKSQNDANALAFEILQCWWGAFRVQKYVRAYPSRDQQQSSSIESCVVFKF